METATVPQVEKRLYRNNTAGWLGVVKLDHRGEEKGDNVEPFGEVWLSDAEATLTARAPRRPEDNPFEEQTFVGVNSETGAREEYRMRPLVLVSSDARYVPNERYVPTEDVPDTAGASPPVARSQASPLAEAPAPASTGSNAATEAPAPAAPAQPPVASPPPRTQPVSGPPPAPVTSASGQRVDGVTQDQTEEERKSWLVEPEAPGQVIAGSLGGDDQGTGADAPDPTNAPTQAERYVPPVAEGAAPQQPGGVPAEEHAEAVDPRIGEETGAARPPAAPAPQGEYASHEEIGSPDAPAQDDEPVEGLIGG